MHGRLKDIFRLAAITVGVLAIPHSEAMSADAPPELAEVTVKSSLDGSEQPSRLWVPDSANDAPVPLLVFLHSWSGDYRQDNSTWLQQAAQRGWAFLHPNFRGPNDEPAACGSSLARQDVIDAVDYVLSRYKIDRSRIYLAGSSGGGHMSMLMAGYFPQRFSAVSAWVGISDLADWYRFHVKDGKPQRYAQMIAASCGGAPGDSPVVDAEYKARSPIFHLHKAAGLPLDLNAGVEDGHTGSVPIRHTLRAYNVLAATSGGRLVSDEEMEQLWQNRRLKEPQKSDEGFDPTYGRKIFLRRKAGTARVTIFDGGHEGIARAGCEWLSKRSRRTSAERSLAK